MSKYLFVAALAAISLGGTAWADAGPGLRGGQVLERSSRPALDGSIGLLATGSISEGLVAGALARDVQGRDLRSSTRGNAQFPERPYEAQNLGGTAGGPAF